MFWVWTDIFLFFRSWASFLGLLATEVNPVCNTYCFKSSPCTFTLLTFIQHDSACCTSGVYLCSCNHCQVFCMFELLLSPMIETVIRVWWTVFMGRTPFSICWSVTIFFFLDEEDVFQSWWRRSRPNIVAWLNEPFSFFLGVLLITDYYYYYFVSFPSDCFSFDYMYYWGFWAVALLNSLIKFCCFLLVYKNERP